MELDENANNRRRKARGSGGTGEQVSVVYDLAFDFHSRRFAVSSEDDRIRIFAKDGSRDYEKVAEVEVREY